MRLGKPSFGEVMAGLSAIVLYISTTYVWFGTELSSESAITLFSDNRNAWDTLAVIPSILLIAVFAALVTVTIRLVNPAEPKLLPADAAVAVLGLVSTLLIFFRIVDPPSFGRVGTTVGCCFGPVSVEATAQTAIFVALAAAASIAIGGFLAMKEEGFSFTRPAGDP
jgi:hypothetical protein